MLSITRFKKFMTCYFATVFIGFFIYVTFYHRGSSGERVQTTATVNVGDRDVIPYVIENDTKLDEFQDALMEKVNQELRGIGSEDEAKGNQSLELPSDEDLDMMMDALHYALPTHALGLEDTWDNTTGTSTVTPDYFFRSLAYTESSTEASTEDGATPAPKVEGFPEELENRLNDLLESNELVEKTSQTNETADTVQEVIDQVESFDDSLSYYDDDDDDDDIPHIIHQTSTTTQVPKQVETCIPSWSTNHPFWLHWFWTESAFIEMVLYHFPDSKDVYQKYTHQVNRADVRKYFLIYKEGGVFADLDLESLKPLDDDLLEKQCILAREPFVHRELLYNVKTDMDLVTPAFIACRPGHPFFKYVIDNLAKYAEKAKYLEWEDNVLNSTGTMFLSEVLAAYRKQPHEPKDAVYVAPAEFFMPTFDPVHETHFRVKCNGYKLDISLTSSQKEACEILTQADFNMTVVESSYTRHNWLGSWKSEFDLGNTVSLHSVDQSITIFDR